MAALPHGSAQVTVCIPTFNGAPVIDEVLAAVLSQRTDFRFDVLVIDSGSRDGTVEIIKRHGVRLIEIPNHEFGHGRTRNVAVERSETDLVAFLTQDATPAGDSWLRYLVGAFDVAPDVVAAYGPHIARPDAHPKTHRDQTAFFAGMGPSDRATVHRRGDIVFFSDVNSCIKKEFWAKVPFRDLPYSEDQAFGQDVLEAGAAKVFEPRAAVIHSHTFPPTQYFRRMFDEWSGIKAAIGASFTPRLRTAAHLAWNAIRTDVRYIWGLTDASTSQRLRWVSTAAFMDVSRELTAYLVEHQSRLPDWAKDRLSYERHLKRKLHARRR